MKTKLLALGVTASLLMAAGCNRDAADAEVASAGPTVVTTPNEAASQAPEAMPQTMAQTPANTTAGTGMPDAPATGNTLVISATPGPNGGTYLADSAGQAVYTLEGDRDGSKCTGACLSVWPPLLVGETQPTAGPNIDPSKVASIKRPDGSMQVTFNNRPLYRYAADQGQGRTSGHDVKDQTGHWYLLTAQGEKYSGDAAAKAGAPAAGQGG
ncbi:hypothetical protein ACFFGH_07200 [Lysobacter korlensis]|uniref:Lipoprotein n=1 Tax=Lysobacter korlensis TaxID=553636 RepID=A0ABV6RKZ6_9GAMM